MVSQRPNKYTSVQFSERIDQIAIRVLGDCDRYYEIIELNPFLDIFHPEAEMIIEVPND
jgi:hypothetical protein